jgi:hypothetical protein
MKGAVNPHDEMKGSISTRRGRQFLTSHHQLRYLKAVPRKSLKMSRKDLDRYQATGLLAKCKRSLPVVLAISNILGKINAV